jgi:H+/Cl- antiporter ClcA
MPNIDQNIDSIIETSKSFYREGSTRVEEVRFHVLRLLPFWIAGSMTALTATIYARLFSICEKWSLQIFEDSGYWFLLFVPACFFVSWILVERYAPFANGSGIPQLMKAIDLTQDKKNSFVDKLLGFRIILVKVMSSLIGVIGGGAIGREGPTLQIAGSIFHIVDRKWKLGGTQARSGFLLAGAASGLASAFNTPLGGIVYVIEELAKSHLSTFRTGVVHAVIFAGLISQLIMGPYLYFGYPKIGDFQYGMILETAVLAICAALVVTLFSQFLKIVVNFRGNLKTFRSRALMTLGCGFLFAAFSIWISKNSLGPGKFYLNELIFDGKSAQYLDVLARFVGTILTYSNGGAGGIFAPTLSLGGSASSMVENFLGYEFGPLGVLIGMTAGLAALTHSPLTSFILILEMTDRHNSIFPLMIAAVIGHGVSKIISKMSFYDFVFHKLSLNLDLKQSSNES